MSPSHPPSGYFQPNIMQLPPGSTLIRIHSSQYEATAFRILNQPSSEITVGGRFDPSDEDNFGFLYAASDDETAAAEVLMRDLHVLPSTRQFIPLKTLDNNSISCVETRVDLPLVTLRTDADLKVIGQDRWLTTSPASDYPLTREWASAIREWEPEAAGMTWRSKRNPPGDCYVFFLDRCHSGDFVTVSSPASGLKSNTPLSYGPGKFHIAKVLDTLHVSLSSDTPDDA